jgi:hypothetical protein
MTQSHAPTPERARELLRDCHGRRLDREGIPMVLALADESRPVADRAGNRTDPEGAEYADLLGAYADLLVPSDILRHDDEAAVITALQVLAYGHFDPAVTTEVTSEDA